MDDYQIKMEGKFKSKSSKVSGKVCNKPSLNVIFTDDEKKEFIK